MTRQFIKAGDIIIPLSSVQSVDISRLESCGVAVILHANGTAEAREFDAFEAVMLVHPSALEGRRLRWAKHAWAFHNLVAHPLMQVMVWCGFKRQAIWLHDVTVPKPTGLRAAKGRLV
jgi:hypothetical protein